VIANPKSIILMVLSTCLIFLGLCEVLLRYNDSFNSFVYTNSTPRNSDDFRVFYRLARTREIRNTPITAFIGTSITRDGVDVRLFEEKFPGHRFINLGGTHKLPHSEVKFIDKYFDAGITTLVYWISGADFKLRKFSNGTHTDYFPGLAEYANVIRNPSLKKITRVYPRFWGDLLGTTFLTFRFREVLGESFEIATIKALGIDLRYEFDFFWDHQGFDDNERNSRNLRYLERPTSYFDKRLADSLANLETLAASASKYKIQLLFLYSPGVCERFHKTFPKHVLNTEENFAAGIAEISERFDHVQLHELKSFSCDNYAEMFHLNGAGRLEFFRRVSKLLEPIYKVSL